MAGFLMTVLRWFFHLRMTIRPIEGQDIEPAARLLALQFATREPLTRHLKLRTEDLMPLFREHLAFCAREGTGVVAISRSGAMLGVITAEDDFAPFVPSPEVLTPETAQVGRILDAVQVPKTWQSQRARDLFYCDLAAVDPQLADKHVLAALTLGIFDHLSRLGFQRGYAKVTNARMVARLRGFERLLSRSIFKELADHATEDGTRIVVLGWMLDFYHR